MGTSELRQNKLVVCTSKVMLYAVGGIFACLLIIGLYMGTYGGGIQLSSLIYAIGLLAVLYRYIPKWSNKRMHSTRKTVITLTVVCFFVKLAWVWFVRIEPLDDYKTFYDYAVTLSQSWRAENQYIALFPHIMGYSTFLSVFFKLFGARTLLPQLLNVVLTVITGLMTYKITEKMVSPRAAVYSYIGWIIMPSQTMYNNLVLSEPLYTTFIVGYFLLLIVVNESANSSKVWIIGMGLVGGITLRMINVVRPIAVILVIATIIWLFVLRMDRIKNSLKKWIFFLVPLLVVYIALGSVWNLYLSSRLGQESATVPGFTIYVGTNEESRGSWNSADSALLSEYLEEPGATVQSVQVKLLEDAKDRIVNGRIRLKKLFIEKVKTFLGGDSGCVDYNYAVLECTEELACICNVAYYMLVILCLKSVRGILKKGADTTNPVLMLYVIGLTLAHTLVEVAVRYHYSIIPVLIILASYNVDEVLEKQQDVHMEIQLSNEL